jgi:hypothetical protein
VLSPAICRRSVLDTKKVHPGIIDLIENVWFLKGKNHFKDHPNDIGTLDGYEISWSTREGLLLFYTGIIVLDNPI